MKMSNKMRRIVGMILVIVGIMMAFGSTANAVYNEEENTIDYEFVMSLAALGMKPDIKVDDSGMIWTRVCTLADLAKTAEELDGDIDFAGDGMVYMWYSMIDNIGTMTITGEFTYYYGEDETVYNYYQAIFECDEYGELEIVTNDIDS